MGTRTLPFALLALLSLPVAASAQPTLYVCTPSAKILKVNAGPPSVVFSGTGTFEDCVLGPDGLLYIANDNSILRVSTDGASSSVIASGLSFRVKSLAFNVTTLYITAAVPPTGRRTSPTGAVYTLTGSPTNDGVNTSGPLDFSGSPTPTNPLFATSSPANGIVFDVVGNMVVGSGTRLDSAAPPLYTGPSALIGSGIGPVGVAIDTCKEVVYADTATNTIRRVGSPQALASFSEFPLYLEVDSSNVLYVVTNAKLDGSGAAKVWKVDLGFATTNCTPSAPVTPVLVANLKTDLPSGTPSDGMGIAVAATNKALTTSYSASHCGSEDETVYDFGYHRVTLEFTDCANTFPSGTSANVTVEALKSLLSDVTFSGVDFANTPKPIEGMRYSPMGGFIVQYKINVAYPNTNPPGFSVAQAPVRLIYHFDTQEVILAPGVAKTTNDTLNAFFDQNVGTDYWEAGRLDPPAGERGDTCCSKHVVYNAGAVGAAQCTFGFDQPFRSGNPLFNSGSQTIAISGSATLGRFNCDGGVLRVSLFRYEGFPSTASCANREQATDVTFLTATSNIQEDNIMDVQQNKYKYNLQTKDLTPGVYLLTLAGPLHTAPGTTGSLNITTACFQFSR